MLRTMVMHELDYNYIAPCEEWYYRLHAPQLARRYGPWLERFESYRPVPLPADLKAEALGYTNWLVTVGFWREIPKEGPQGELCLSTPPVDARNMSIFLPPQSSDDFKGSNFAPEEKACLRFVCMLEYPAGVDKKEADDWFVQVLAKEISEVESVWRFFGTPAVKEEIHLPGMWKKEAMERMQKNHHPNDHTWDRLVEIWFETFDDVREFLEKAKHFSAPSWAQTESFPFLEPYENFASTFLLERPAYDWKENFNVYR